MHFNTLKQDWLFIICSSCFFFISIAISVWDFWVVQHTVVSNIWITNLGIILFVAGILFRIYLKHILSKYYSYGLEIKEGHKLITTGIYHYIRHPLYLAMLIYSLAIPLIFTSFLGFLIMLGLIPCILYRIKIEELMLLRHFGKKYQDYQTYTVKLIPFIY